MPPGSVTGVGPHCSVWRGLDLSLSIQSCNFSGTAFGVIFIFSSGAQCIYQHCTAQALTPSHAPIHKNLFIVREGGRVCAHTERQVLAKVY